MAGRIHFTCCNILIIYAVALPWVAAANGPACPPPVAPEPIAISHVIDGDTVVLANGARLRLIGIDTPELGTQAEAGPTLGQGSQGLPERTPDGTPG